MRTVASAFAIAATLSGCATSRPATVGCTNARLAENPRFAAWNIDKFAGTYRNGSATLTVARIGEHRFVVTRAGEQRDLATDTVESWLFHDGCGSTYQFVLPPDGPGGWLTITDPGGAKSEWRRD